MLRWDEAVNEAQTLDWANWPTVNYSLGQVHGPLSMQGANGTLRSVIVRRLLRGMHRDQ
jgi:hypothetical protein